jgi:DNA repair protein RadA/Sms
MLVEVQALVSAFGSGVGRRTATGVDAARLSMLLAVLERKVGLSVASADVFVNVAGGVRVEEPAADLPVALAVASSLRDRAVAEDVVAFGEIGLAGEVRSVPRIAARLTEAAAMGFRRAIAPASAADVRTVGIDVVPVRTLDEAIAAALTA